MAKIGMEYVCSAELTESNAGGQYTRTYANGRYWGPSSSFTGSPTNSDVKDFGDDRACETDVSFSNGSLSVELNENTLALEAWLLGHTYDASTKKMVCNSADVPPFLGTAAIGKSRRNNVTIYRVIVYYKTQFASPEDGLQTKQENTTFNHTTLSGSFFECQDHAWKEMQEFDTLDAAKTYINTLFGIS